jgi:hypothetical protein
LLLRIQNSSITKLKGHKWTDRTETPASHCLHLRTLHPKHDRFVCTASHCIQCMRWSHLVTGGAPLRRDQRAVGMPPPQNLVDLSWCLEKHTMLKTVQDPSCVRNLCVASAGAAHLPPLLISSQGQLSFCPNNGSLTKELRFQLGYNYIVSSLCCMRYGVVKL